MTKYTEVAALFEQIKSDLGNISAVILNGCIPTLPYDATPEQYANAASVNVVIVHVILSTLLAEWQQAGHGKYLITGGGLADNGAYAVGLGLQFGACAKAYVRNFAQVSLFTFLSLNYLLKICLGCECNTLVFRYSCMLSPSIWPSVWW